MTDFLRIVNALQQQMSATFSRSDVLRPLHVMLGTIALFVLGLAYAGDKVPAWAFTYAFYGLAATIFLELGAYLYCLIYDRDALRSEKYQLQKMAIEAQILGDSTQGLFEERAEPALPQANRAKQLGTSSTVIDVIPPAATKTASKRKRGEQ